MRVLYTCARRHATEGGGRHRPGRIPPRMRGRRWKRLVMCRRRAIMAGCETRSRCRSPCPERRQACGFRIHHGGDNLDCGISAQRAGRQIAGCRRDHAAATGRVVGAGAGGAAGVSVHSAGGDSQAGEVLSASRHNAARQDAVFGCMGRGRTARPGAAARRADSCRWWRR